MEKKCLYYEKSMSTKAMKEVVLFLEMGQIKYFLRLTCSYSQMCIKIYDFVLQAGVFIVNSQKAICLKIFVEQVTRHSS